MFILFIVILVVGLAGFFFVLMKELKGAPPTMVSLRGMPMASASLGEKPPEPPVSSEKAEADHAVEMKILREASEQKILKLEQMLEEKNKLITDLQVGVQAGREYEQQIESLKQILQTQIDELKQQNKQLKDEITRLTEDNMDLQTKAYALQIEKEPSVPQVDVYPTQTPEGPVRADEIPSAEEPPAEPEAKGHVEKGEQGTLSLHDIFGAEPDEPESRN